MNARELETQHNLKKWAAIIKECRSSGMKILQWLEINNISKDQYYYWQKKLKETCIDTFERQAATFVELPVTKEVPASTELTVTHGKPESWLIWVQIIQYVNKNYVYIILIYDTLDKKVYHIYNMNR